MNPGGLFFHGAPIYGNYYNTSSYCVVSKAPSFFELQILNQPAWSTVSGTEQIFNNCLIYMETELGIHSPRGMLLVERVPPSLDTGFHGNLPKHVSYS